MRLLFEGGSYLRAALNNGFTVFQVDIPERNFVWTHSSWDPFAGSTDLSYENHYTFNDLIIVLIFFVAGFKNTDFLFFTPQFSRNFLISPPKNDSHIIKEHSFTLPKTLWWIWKKNHGCWCSYLPTSKETFVGSKNNIFALFIRRLIIV